MKTTPTPNAYGACEAQRCDARAVNLCPRCGMALCAACLARHARFPGVAITARRQRQREEPHEEDGGRS